MLPSEAAQQPATYPRLSAAERLQRGHELFEAHEAARHLEARLEMCIGSSLAARRVDVRRLREEIAIELLELEQIG